MTFHEMEQELVAVRALLKEAVTHADEAHDDACKVWTVEPVDFKLDTRLCNCWLFYATRVIAEAEQAEQKQAEAQSHDCTCHHPSGDHINKGAGFCTSANCDCNKFTAALSRAV